MRIWRWDRLWVVYFLALPVVVAAGDWGVGAAVLGVLAGLLLRWATVAASTAKSLRREEKTLVLETIAASHYVEKVRWALDRLGLAYREEPSVGVLGVFLTGRSVPRLRVGEGAGACVLGDSTEILRFLWGVHGQRDPDRARFLEPTAEAVALERDIDAYGADVRRWLYHHGLPDRAYTLQLWGRHDARLPRWQRWSVDLGYPLLVLFLRTALSINAAGAERSVGRAEQFLSEMEARLADQPKGLLGPERSYVDYAFAGHSSLWLNCAGYGGGRAEGYMPPADRWPESLRRDIRAWRERYPRVVAFAEGLYAAERCREQESPIAR